MAIRNYCTFEDRQEALVGVKLLALSLEKHCLDYRFWIVLRSIPAGLEDWLRTHAPRARLVEYVPVHGTWNIKAEVLSHFLSSVVDEIIWIDSDIIILRDLDELWSKAGQEVVVAQEYDLPSMIHPSQLSVFGDISRRSLPHAVNSGVLRFDRSQLPIVERWRRNLENLRYRQEQHRPFSQRTVGLRSDQDVLEYTLCTIDHPSAASPVYVCAGTEIIQDHGSTTYAMLHRLKNISGWGRPFFVHALGAKPWDRTFARHDSVYVEFAQAYSEHLDASLRRARSGMVPHLFRSEVRAHLRGLPRCFVGKAARFLTTGSFRRPLDADSARPSK